MIVLAASQVVLATESASDEGYLGQQYASSIFNNLALMVRPLRGHPFRVVLVALLANKSVLRRWATDLEWMERHLNSRRIISS